MKSKDMILKRLSCVQDGTLNPNIFAHIKPSSALTSPLIFLSPSAFSIEALAQEQAPDSKQNISTLLEFFTPEESIEDHARASYVDNLVPEAEYLSIDHQTQDPEFGHALDSEQDFIPDENFISQLPFQKYQAPPVPDISGALAKRQDRHELKALEEFAMQKLVFGVFDNELCLFSSPCWRRLDSQSCTICLRSLFRKHKLDIHLGTSDYKEIYRSLCTNPLLQKGSVPEPPLHRLNLLDSTLNLETQTFYPHTPEDGFFNYLKLSSCDILDPGEGTIFEDFISSVSDRDPNVRQQVLELIALSCTGYQIKAFFVLVGPSGTGKSQLARFLVELLGHDSAASVGGIHELGSRFSLANMEDKRLAVCMDLPNTPLPATAIGTLKVATGNDAKKIEAKHKNPKTVYRSPLWVFASNFPLQIPNVEREDAFLQRMILIPFLHAVPPEKQIQQLYRKLLEESAYIVSQSICAYQTLMQNNFILTRSSVPSEYSPGEARETVSDIQSFLDRYCVYDSSATITTERLYRTFLATTNSNQARPISKIAFGKVLSEILKKQPAVFEVKRAENRELRGYRGIRLNDFNSTEENMLDHSHYITSTELFGELDGKPYDECDEEYYRYYCEHCKNSGFES